ncbi:hypothetical protein AGMMS49975_22320 [Clostridia bacterium]|nr:hypothetical protein AGMMS49975_22320 [Clostridia bacterium]
MLLFTLLTIQEGGKDWSIVGQSFSLILALVIIGFLAYYFTKMLTRAKITGKFKGNICVIEAVGVGFQNTVQLIKAGEKYILIGASRDRLVFLAEIPADEIKYDDVPTILDSPVFEKYLGKFMKKDSGREDNDKN